MTNTAPEHVTVTLTVTASTGNVGDVVTDVSGKATHVCIPNHAFDALHKVEEEVNLK